MSYAGKVVVLTGASSGIGRSLAVLLAKRGAKVAATARRADLLEALAIEVRSAGGVIATAVADVGDPACVGVLRELAGRLGPVDLVIANAGVGLPSGADPVNAPAVERMMRTNFLGVVHAFEAVLPGMLERKAGHLVAVSSLVAFKGLPGSAGYCASKAAVNSYCEALRIELRDRGVAVTAVCPGFVATPMTANNPEKMPFLMTADEAAERVLRGLRRRPGVFAFPWPMRQLMRLAAWAPDRMIARHVMAKQTQTE